MSLFYDPMLAKLVVHAATRELAVERMLRALGELRVVGVETSAPFHRRVLREPDFRAGEIDIRYIERHPDLASRAPDEAALRAAALAGALLSEEERERRAVRRVDGEGEGERPSRWRDMGWR